MLFKPSDLIKKEEKNLAPYAIKSGKSLGRKFKEKSVEDRLCFQKDKERIIHCKAFRRLDQKTQVFVFGTGDHYRTRLTHTLEVAQISRDLSRRLGLNEDLAETIALAHDLGHPPFGHSGEEALSEILQKFGLHFEHNEQSRRIVERLEKSYPDFDGLNLSHEVLEGLIKHQTAFDQSGKKFEVSAHLEAQVVNLADEIAYTNHDIDDGLRSGLIKLSQLEKLKLWKVAAREVLKNYGEIKDKKTMASRIISRIISLMIQDICETAEKNLKKNRIKTLKDVKAFRGMIVAFSPQMKAIVKEMRAFLYKNFYMNRRVRKDVLKGKKMIKDLFGYYIKHPEKLPKSRYLDNKADLKTNIKDYIAGMTDSFLIKEYETFIMRS